jgi:single-stranded-DNA-specific exonuclease
MAIQAPGSRWIIRERDRAAESLLQKQLGVPSIVAGVLAQRGYTDPEAAHKFLNPSLSDLCPPEQLPDYQSATKAILGAKERGDLIYVHGDYDVDGVTSAALFNRFLSKIGCKVQTHVPHRMKEGYGIHKSAVEAARVAGAKLFLTCDCGVSAHEQVAMAKEAGMEVVITDHHSIAGELPRAEAVVNPHRVDSEYPFHELSGVGVVLKLCAGISSALDFPRDSFYRAYMDLAALGTIADVMPLVGENRIIAKFGLERLTETKKAGLQALFREAKLMAEPGRALRSYDVGFVIGPRLNAAGRIDDAALALKLLLTNEVDEAQALASQIEEVNTRRRADQAKMCDEAIEKVLQKRYFEKNVILVEDPNWHTGIVGIVASRLVEQFRRPTFVLAVDEISGTCKGSGRSIPKFHLAEAIWAHPGLFSSGGGHAMAAGCSFEYAKIDEIRAALDAYASERLTPEDFVPEVVADMEIDFSEINMAALDALSRLEPFGCENPDPIFVSRGVTLSQLIPTKSPQHVQVSLRQGEGEAVKGIAFGIGERLSEFGAGAVADMLIQPKIDEWRGNRNLKVHVKDFRPLYV